MKSGVSPMNAISGLMKVGAHSLMITHLGAG